MIAPTGIGPARIAPVILVPAYEPDEQLLALIHGLHTADPELVIVVVDDGSGPAFDHIFYAAAGLGCILLTLPDNRGKGQALKTGFAEIGRRLPGRAVICADSDGQHSVLDILRVAAAVGIPSDTMVLGERRLVGDVPARSRFGNAATRWLFRLATGRQLHDTQTGLRGYPPSMLGWLGSVDGDRYEYELNLLLQAARDGRPIDSIEIATIYLSDNHSSHFRPVADSLRIYAPLLRFLCSSLTAFVIDAAALLAISAATGSLLVAVVGARLVSSTVNFAINRQVVFDRESRRPAGPAALKYFALVMTLLMVNVGLLTGLTAIGIPLLPAKLLTELALVVLSYAVQSRFVFAGGLPAHPAPAEPRRALATTHPHPR